MEVSDGIDSFDCVDSSFDRFVSGMALQPRLGLLAQRRLRHDSRDRAHPAPARLRLESWVRGLAVAITEPPRFKARHGEMGSRRERRCRGMVVLWEHLSRVSKQAI